jgi:hypothetical protein
MAAPWGGATKTEGYKLEDEMSTRGSLKYGPSFHLFTEGTDAYYDAPEIRGRLWLELRDVQYTAGAGQDGKGSQVTVELSPVVLSALRAHLCENTQAEARDSQTLQEAAAHLVWAVENGLTDVRGAALAVKELLPADALARFNACWAEEAGEE